MKITEAAVVAQIVAAAQQAQAQPEETGAKAMKPATAKKVKAQRAPSPAVVGEGYEPKVVAPSTQHYALGDKAARDMQTLQAGAKTGQGKAWRVVASAKRNTRVVALEAIADAMGEEEQVTEDVVLAALATVKDQLGSGSPRSYLRAFVASGYLVVV